MAESKKEGAGALSAAAAKRKREPRTAEEIADATGVTELNQRIAEGRNVNTVRRFKNPVPGEPDIIEGETIEQMRERVRQERLEAEPSEFQKSVLGGQVPVQREEVRSPTATERAGER